jgi:hypothetical protein
MFSKLLALWRRKKKVECFLVEAFRAGETKPYARIKAPDLFLAHHFASEQVEYNGIFQQRRPEMVRHCKIHLPCGSEPILIK